MEQEKLYGINLLEFGNTIQIAGILMNGPMGTYLIPLPEEEISDPVPLPFDLDEWKIFLRQTDLQEVEVLANDGDGLKKAILRKSSRQIDAGVTWRVFKRDEYTCRYCGKDDVPLTIDHLVLWEKGGPTIEDNLVSSCKKCNKKRGNMEYKDWLESDYYKRVSKNLPEEVRELNCVVKFTLSGIPIKHHIISRGSKKKKGRGHGGK